MFASPYGAIKWNVHVASNNVRLDFVPLAKSMSGTPWANPAVQQINYGYCLQDCPKLTSSYLQ